MSEKKEPIGGGWDSAVSTELPQQPKESGWDGAVSTETMQTPQGTSGRPGTGALIDQSERIVSTIGSGYLQSYLSGGGVGKGIGILTQKRFYYKGRNFSGMGRAARSTTEEGVVSIEDITFTKLSRTRHIGAIITGVLLILISLLLAKTGTPDGLSFLGPLFMAVGLASFVLFFVKRHTLFVVAFPGGSFAFNIHYYPISDIRDFQRQLHLLKDRIKGA